MNSSEFRKELVKIMPGYSWTIHRFRFRGDGSGDEFLSATGIQSSGSNRHSTLRVERIERHEKPVEYIVKSSGYGRRAPWLSENTGGTLARALRGLQNHYEAMERTYANHSSALQYGRKSPNQKVQ